MINHKLELFLFVCFTGLVHCFLRLHPVQSAARPTSISELLAETADTNNNEAVSEGPKPHPPEFPPPESILENGHREFSLLRPNQKPFFVQSPFNQQKTEAAKSIESSFSSLEGGMEEDNLWKFVKQSEGLIAEPTPTSKKYSNVTTTDVEIIEKISKVTTSAVRPILSGEVERNVPEDAIKGALLAGAVAAGLAGQGALVSGAASLGAAYVAITNGPIGKVFRSVGSLAWGVSTETINAYQKSLETRSSEWETKRAKMLMERQLFAARRKERNQRALLATRIAIDAQVRARAAQERVAEWKRLNEEKKRLEEESLKLQARLEEVARLQKETEMMEERRRMEIIEQESRAVEFARLERQRRERVAAAAAVESEKGSQLAFEDREEKEQQLEEERMARETKLAGEQEQRIREAEQVAKHARLEELKRLAELEYLEKELGSAEDIAQLREAVSLGEQKEADAQIADKDDCDNMTKIQTSWNKISPIIEENINGSKFIMVDEADELLGDDEGEEDKSSLEDELEEEKDYIPVVPENSEFSSLVAQANVDGKFVDDTLYSGQKEKGVSSVDDVFQGDEEEQHDGVRTMSREDLEASIRNAPHDTDEKMYMGDEEDSNSYEDEEESHETTIQGELEDEEEIDKDEDDDMIISQEDWEASIRVAQESIDGKMVMMDEEDDIMYDGGEVVEEKRGWNAAMQYARELGNVQDSTDEENKGEIDSDVIGAAASGVVQPFNYEEEEEDYDMDSKEAVDIFDSDDDYDNEDNDVDSEAIAIAARAAVESYLQKEDDGDNEAIAAAARAAVESYVVNDDDDDAGIDEDDDDSSEYEYVVESYVRDDGSDDDDDDAGIDDDDDGTSDYEYVFEYESDAYENTHENADGDNAMTHLNLASDSTIEIEDSFNDDFEDDINPEDTLVDTESLQTAARAADEVYELNDDEDDISGSVTQVAEGVSEAPKEKNPSAVEGAIAAEDSVDSWMGENKSVEYNNDDYVEVMDPDDDFIKGMDLETIAALARATVDQNKESDWDEIGVVSSHLEDMISDDLGEEDEEEYMFDWVGDEIVDSDGEVTEKANTEMWDANGFTTPQSFTKWGTFPLSRLQAELKARGLPTAGKKADLVTALEQSDLEIMTSLSLVDTAESFLGNGDEPTDEDLQKIEETPEVASLQLEPTPSLYFADMTVAELKEELRARNLRVSGKKAVLLERLRTYESEKIDYGA